VKALPILAAGFLVLGSAVSGAAQTGPGHRRATAWIEPAPPTDRPPDHLLDRPDLQALVEAQEARETAPLVDALGANDSVVRARAAFALASVQEPAAVPALLRALADPAAGVRADAAFALGQTADSSASKALLTALESETNPVARDRILEALGKVGDEASLERVAATRVPADELGALALAIGRYGLRGVGAPAAVSRLVAILGDPATAPPVREDAAYYFGRAKEPADWTPAADTLRALLDAGAPLLQGHPEATVAPVQANPALLLVTALGRLSDPRDDARLMAWLERGTDWRVRVNAARALGGRAPAAPAVGQALVRALGDPSVHVAVAAAGALSAADSLPPAVAAAINDWFLVPRERWQVAAALAPAVVKSGAAQQVLMKLVWLDARSEPRPAERAALLAALGAGDDEAGLKVLIDQSDAEDARVAAAAVEALGARWARAARGPDPPARRYYAAFAAALGRSDLATAAAAAPALGDSLFRPLGSVDALQSAYRGMEAPVDVEPMIEILKALGAAGDSTARPLLEEALRDPRRVLRQAAAEALTRLTGQPVAPPEVPEPPAPAIDWARVRDVGARGLLLLDTDRGRIVFRLDPEQAPLTVQTLARLAEAGKLAGVPFHRVAPNFVVQGGDVSRADGYGGPGFAIRSELTRIPFERGTIGMASAGKDTEGSQYFVTHSPQPHLDGRYTAFGWVVDGLGVVDALQEGDRVTHAEIRYVP